METTWNHTITKLCKVDSPSTEAVVPKQVRMQKAKSEIETVALDFTRQLQRVLEINALLWARCQVGKYKFCSILMDFL